MKKTIGCTFCKHDLKNDVYKAFDNYTVGRIKCSNCSNVQKRYLSEADMMLYFHICCVLYLLTIYASYSLLVYIQVQTLWIVLGILVLFAGIYLLTHVMCRWIYDKAPFKEEWKDFVLKEDRTAIQKRMRWQFIVLIVIGYFFGTQPAYTLFFYIMIIAFIIICVIKLRLILRNEKAEYLKKSH